MACEPRVLRDIDSETFLAQLASSPAGDDGLPLAASIELTARCNLRCRHCYISHPGSPKQELDTPSFSVLFDKLAKAGVLLLVITGGEPLVRNDFRTLYLRARNLGFLVTLLTNGTLIDEAAADWFAKYPPRRIELTMYGHCEATYESITQVPGSYRRFHEGLALLLKRKLPVYLKTMVMKTNAHELESIRQFAGSRGLPFRYDASINPRLNGDLAPLSERISPEEYARLLHGDQASAESFARLRNRTPGSDPDPRLFRCGAGTQTAHIDSTGNLHPCMMWRSTPYSFLTGSVSGWKKHLNGIGTAELPEKSRCLRCPDRRACSACPPLSLLEAGQAGMEVPFFCAVCKSRENLLEKTKEPV